MSLPAVIDYIGFMKVEKTAYLKIRFDWLYSIYVVFAVAMIVRYLWLGWQAICGQGAGSVRSHQGGLRRMNLASPFSLSLVAITALAFLGLPIGLAMIAGSILYLCSPATTWARWPSSSSTACTPTTSSSPCRCSSSLPRS